MDNPLLNNNLLNNNNIINDLSAFKPIEISPIIGTSGNETMFKGYGNSHISHVKNEGFHISTQVPGISGGLTLHDSVNSLIK